MSNLKFTSFLKYDFAYEFASSWFFFFLNIQKANTATTTTTTITIAIICGDDDPRRIACMGVPDVISPSSEVTWHSSGMTNGVVTFSSYLHLQSSDITMPTIHSA